VEKGRPKIWATFVHYSKKLSEVNNRPIWSPWCLVLFGGFTFIHICGTPEQPCQPDKGETM
jgi:hypothetical protein